MRTIPITVNDEYIKGAGAVVGAAGSHSDVILDITFGDAWDGLSKSIVWRNSKHNNPIRTLLSAEHLVEGTTNEYRVPIPAEPKEFAGEMTMTIKGVSVSGTEETSAILTAYGEFVVMESLWDEDAAPSGDIPATMAEQVQAVMDELASQVSTILPKVAAVYGMEVAAETLAPENQAYVTKEIVEGIMNLTFGIPRGLTGAKGEKGDTGRQGEKGDTGSQGPQGVPGRDGTDGINGTVVETHGYFAFDVHEDGDLYLTYTGDTAPLITLDQTDGHLYMDVEVWDVVSA